MTIVLPSRSIVPPSLPAEIKTFQDEQYTVVQAGRQKSSHHNKSHLTAFQDEEPLIDTTAPLTLISKKTKRLEKQALRKKSHRQNIASFATLPTELLLAILSWVPPSTIKTLLLLNRTTNEIIKINQTTIAKSIISFRYTILSQCFPLPAPVSSLDPKIQAILLTPRRQEMLSIHKRPYQHIPLPDPEEACSCTSCILAWNNLCLVLDFAHFQGHLDNGTPLPMIPRGEKPDWNAALLAKHGEIVRRAMREPLAYVDILERHLNTIIRTITRTRLQRKYVLSASGKHVPTKETFNVPVFSQRPYNLTDAEAASGLDYWLSREGQPSYEFPYHRDTYYTLEVYLPNRKWSRELGEWRYFAKGLHEVDVAWAERWFGPRDAGTKAVARDSEKGQEQGQNSGYVENRTSDTTAV